MRSIATCDRSNHRMTYLDINFVLLERVHCNRLNIGSKANSLTLTAAIVFVGFDLTKVPKSLDIARYWQTALGESRLQWWNGNLIGKSMYVGSGNWWETGEVDGLRRYVGCRNQRSGTNEKIRGEQSRT